MSTQLWAPSASSAALRHSRALNVGTFHSPTEHSGLDSARPPGRRTGPSAGSTPALTSYDTTARPAQAVIFPGRPGSIMPGADEALARGGGARGGRAASGSSSPTGRSAPRCGCSCGACAGVSRSRRWTATIVSARGPSSSTPLRADLQERVTYVTPDDLGEAEALARADVLVAASDGAAPAPGLVLRALDAQVVALASRLAVYEEVLGEGGTACSSNRATGRRSPPSRSGSSTIAPCASACGPTRGPCAPG